MLTIAAFLAHNCCASFLSLWPEVSAKGIFCASSSFQQQEYWGKSPASLSQLRTHRGLFFPLDLSAPWMHRKLAQARDSALALAGVHQLSPWKPLLCLWKAVALTHGSHGWLVPSLPVSAGGAQLCFIFFSQLPLLIFWNKVHLFSKLTTKSDWWKLIFI